MRAINYCTLLEMSERRADIYARLKSLTDKIVKAQEVGDFDKLDVMYRDYFLLGYEYFKVNDEVKRLEFICDM